MTAERGEIAQARVDMLKIARAVIRLKHSLVADRELNVALPALESAFDERVQRGELPDDTTLREIVGEVLGG